MRGLTTCVGYADLLALTLPANMRHLSECVVITSPDDTATQDLARSIPGVNLSITDAFTRHGARFNKGLAIEEAGFEFMGRQGWIWIFDADIMFPDHLPIESIKPTKLYGCRRRILEDPAQWSPDLDWRRCPISRDIGPIGYTQIFHCDDACIKNKRPWYDVSFGHAGGSDAFFVEHWHCGNRVVLPFHVLHLGKTDMNWFGCDQKGRDLMAKFVRENGWHRAARKHSEESARRAPEVVERVEVPGYAPSNFTLPFVKRAQSLKLARGGLP